MKFRFTNHAQYQIRDRNVFIEDIKQTLLYPNAIRPSFGGRLVNSKILNERLLEVVYLKQKKEYVILTVYYKN